MLQPAIIFSIWHLEPHYVYCDGHVARKKAENDLNKQYICLNAIQSGQDVCEPANSFPKNITQDTKEKSFGLKYQSSQSIRLSENPPSVNKPVNC